MRCFKCGREVSDDARFCDRCGYEVAPSYPSLLHDRGYQQRQKVYQRDFYFVVAIFLVFLLVIVPVAIYFLFVAIEDTGVDIPAGDLVASKVPGGMKFAFSNVTFPVPWFGIQISIWSGEVGWATGWQVGALTMEMFGNMTWYGDESPLGSVAVRLNVSDFGEDGVIDTGDYFFILTNSTSGFLSGTTYSIDITGIHCSPPFGGFAEATFRE